MIQEGKANVIIGGQWGSEGKGKLAGWLYHTHPEIKVAVSDFTPNTGHTYVDGKGRKHISKILPIGTLFESVELVIIGPHAVIDVDRFKEECNAFRHQGKNATIAIHPLASVLTSADVANERRTLDHIASTMQGSVSAALRKPLRDPKLCSFAKDDPFLKHMIADTHTVIQARLDKGDTVLIETGQGFDLGLNHGHEWPYVTGRDCMIGRSLDSAGVSPKQIGLIIVALRAYPIRVGNVASVRIGGGSSGPCHDDQQEINWTMLSDQLGYAVEERTTVTNRVRRVFTWSDEQVDRMCMSIRPDWAFLNFVNYLRGSGEYDKFVDKVGKHLAKWVCRLRLLGTGPGLNDMVVTDHWL